jgi:hypothetical protein
MPFVCCYTRVRTICLLPWQLHLLLIYGHLSNYSFARHLMERVRRQTLVWFRRQLMPPFPVGTSLPLLALFSFPPPHKEARHGRYQRRQGYRHANRYRCTSGKARAGRGLRRRRWGRGAGQRARWGGREVSRLVDHSHTEAVDKVGRGDVIYSGKCGRACGACLLNQGSYPRSWGSDNALKPVRQGVSFLTLNAVHVRHILEGRTTKNNSY